MALNLHLQNLSRLANNLDIRRFFFGFDIPTGGVSIIGGANGDAFISFNGEDQLLRALLLDKQTLLGQPVRLFLSKQSDMEEVLAKREREKTTAYSSSETDHPTVSYAGLAPIISTTDFPRQKRHLSVSPTRLNLDDISSDEESFCGSEVKQRRMCGNDSFVDSPDRKCRGLDKRESTYRVGMNPDQLIRHDSNEEDRGNGRVHRSMATRDQRYRDQRRARSSTSLHRERRVDQRNSREVYRKMTGHVIDRKGREPSIRSERCSSSDSDVYVGRSSSRSRTPSPIHVRRSSSKSRTPSPVPDPGFVQVCNLPITATATDVRNFFDGHPIEDGGITLQVNARDPGTLIAYVKFVRMKDAIKADCICDGLKLQGQSISVTMISQLVFENQVLAEGPNQHSVQPYQLLPVAYTYPQYGLPPPPPRTVYNPQPLTMHCQPPPPPLAMHCQPPPPLAMHYPPPGYYPPALQGPPLYSANFSPVVYTKMSEPRQEPCVIQQLPKTDFMGKPHLLFNPEAIERMEYYRISRPQSLGPMTSSASKLWSMFGGPKGLCVGVIITHMKNGGPEEAMLAYRTSFARDSAKMCPLAGKVKGVSSVCNGMTMLGVLKQLALSRRSMFVSTVAGPDLLISYQDQQRLVGACIKNKVVEPKKAMLVEKGLAQSVPKSKKWITYLRFVNLRADITACEISGWFIGVNGPCSGVRLVRNAGGPALYAYVAINDFIAAQKSFLADKFQKDHYKICSRHAMLLELSKLDSTYEVVESTAAGKDKLVSIYGKGQSQATVTREATPKPTTEMVNSVATAGVDSRAIAKPERQVTKADGKTTMPVAATRTSTIEVATPRIIDKPESKLKRERRPTSNLVFLK